VTVTVPKADAVDVTTEVTEAPDEAPAGRRRPGWLAWVGGFAVDVFFGAGVVSACLLVAQSASISGRAWLQWTSIAVAVVVFIALVLNRLLGAKAGRERNRRRRTGLLFVVLAAAASVLTVLSYLLVYRPELAVEQARQQLAVQGPKIVQQMLSYNVATIDDDFARARGLATDDYRKKLVAEQDSVHKAGPVNNDYWVTNSAVLTNTRDRAQMLLLMQGQRGEAPKQRLITATLQVSFVRSASGQWQVDNLSVLAKPNPAGEAK